MGTTTQAIVSVAAASVMAWSSTNAHVQDISRDIRLQKELFASVQRFSKQLSRFTYTYIELV